MLQWNFIYFVKQDSKLRLNYYVHRLYPNIKENYKMAENINNRMSGKLQVKCMFEIN